MSATTGTGYPDGLVGEQIPIAARIIAICDAYQAMTSNRSYRDAMSEHEALEELRRCAGSQFDPAITRLFLDDARRSFGPARARSGSGGS